MEEVSFRREVWTFDYAFDDGRFST
jgi:hypothetical protein